MDQVGHLTDELVVCRRCNLNCLDGNLQRCKPGSHQGFKCVRGPMIDLASLPRQTDILVWADELFSRGKLPVPESPGLLLDRLSQSKDPVILVFRLGIETMHERKVRETSIVTVEDKMSVPASEFGLGRHGEVRDSNPDFLLGFSMEADKIPEKDVVTVFQRSPVGIAVTNGPDLGEGGHFGRKNSVSNFHVFGHHTWGKVNVPIEPYKILFVKAEFLECSTKI